MSKGDLLALRAEMQREVDQLEERVVILEARVAELGIDNSGGAAEKSGKTATKVTKAALVNGPNA